MTRTTPADRRRSSHPKPASQRPRRRPLSREEALERMCPACRQRAEEARCSVCGELLADTAGGDNAGFDMARYLRMKEGRKA